MSSVKSYTPKFLKIYEDRELSKPASKLKFDDVVNAGEQSKPVELYVANVSRDEVVDIFIYSDDKDVFIEPSGIDSMKPDEVRKVTFIWNPKLTREQPLSSPIRAKFKVIKRAK